MLLNDSGTANPSGWEKSKNVYRCGFPGGGLGPIYDAPVDAFAELGVRTRSEESVKSRLNQ